MWLSFLDNRNPNLTPLLGDELSDDFIAAFGTPALVTVPSDENNGLAMDFNPTPTKNFGTLNGGVTVVPGGFGVLGQGWNLNGTTGYVSIAGNQGLNITGNLSAIIGTTITTLGNGAHLFGFYANGGAFQGWGLRIGATAIEFWDGTAWRATGWQPTINVPYIIAAVVSGTALTLYANGAQVGSATVSARASYAGPYAIGARSDGASPSAAIVRGAAIYSSALSASQVSALYSCLLYGEPFPLFQPQATGMFFGTAAVATAKVPWQLMTSMRAA